MGTLADIPFLSGYNEQDRINRGRENTDLDRAGAIQGLLAKMQAQKAQQAIIGVMSSDAPMEVKLRQVMRIPGGIEVAGKLAQMQKSQMEAAQAERERAVFSPENIARNTTPGQAAIAEPPPELGGGPGREAIAPRVNVDALRQQAAMTGPKGMEAYSAHQAAEAQRRATMEATAQARKDALEARLFQIETLSQDRALSREQQANLAAQANALRRELADQSNATRSATRDILRPWQIDTVVNRFETNPQVKKVSDLLPEVQVLNDAFKARSKAPVAEKATYDNNLVNAFMRATHPRGGQINRFERADVGALGNIGARIQTGILSYFEGKQLPDDVAAQMVNVVNDKFNAQSKQVRQMHENVKSRVKAAGGDPSLVRDPFEGMSGGQGAQPGIKSFATEAEAAAAGLAPGTRITIGGKSGTWQ